MRATLSVTKIAAISVLLAGSTFVPPAMAQKGSMLSPVSKWSVSRIEGAKAGGQPYCAMARRYSKDLILTVAQNPAREASLALDFQGNSFHAQQLFSLVLDPGAGQERKFQMRPSSENAFVVRLGNDPAFFDALKTTGFLRVGVDNKQYHFDIGDIDEGKAKLDNCIAYLEADPVYGIAAYGSDDKGWSAAASPQKYEQALSELRAHINRLQTEKQSLETVLNTKRSDLDAQQGISAGDPAEEMEALSREVEALSRENEQFMMQIADAGTAAPVEPIKVAEVAALDVPAPPPLPVAPPPAPVAEVNKISADMEALKAKNKALIEGIEKLRAQTKAEYDKLLEEQAKENEALKAALAAGTGAQDEASVLKMQEAIVTLERQKEELGAKMETLEAANAQMGTALQGAQSDEDTLRAQNAELRRTLELAGAALAPEVKTEPEVTAQAAVVQPAPTPTEKPPVPQSMATQAAMKAPDATAAPVEPVEAEAPPMEITQTVGSAEIAQRNSDQIKMMEAKLAALEVVNRDLHETLEQATIRADAYEKEIKAKEVAFAAMQEENKALRQQLAEAQKNGGGANGEKIAALVAENKELKDHVRRLSDDLVQIRAQLAGFENRMAPANSSASAANAAAQSVKSSVSNMAAASEDVAQNAVSQAQSAPSQPPVQQVQRPVKPAPKFNDAEFATAAQKYEAELAYAINENGIAAPAPEVNQASQETASSAALSKAPIEAEVLEDKTLPQEAQDAPKNMLHIGKKDDEPATLEQKEQEAAQKAAAAFAGQAYHFTPDFDIQHLLNEAHVTVPEYVKKVDNAGDKNTLAYRWQSQGVFGSAELKPIVSKMQFDDYVYEYLNITQERCDGEFAVVPERTLEQGGLRLDSYEIACIGGRVDSTASLLFFSKDDTFSVLAQESPMEQMPLVMEARDRLIKTLSNSKS